MIISNRVLISLGLQSAPPCHDTQDDNTGLADLVDSNACVCDDPPVYHWIMAYAIKGRPHNLRLPFVSDYVPPLHRSVARNFSSSAANPWYQSNLYS
jgi:hypothetical protein